MTFPRLDPILWLNLISGESDLNIVMMCRDCEKSQYKSMHLLYTANDVRKSILVETISDLREFVIHTSKTPKPKRKSMCVTHRDIGVDVSPPLSRLCDNGLYPMLHDEDLMPPPPPPCELRPAKIRRKAELMADCADCGQRNVPMSELKLCDYCNSQNLLCPSCYTARKMKKNVRKEEQEKGVAQHEVESFLHACHQHIDELDGDNYCYE
jgi:hypothetical protein